MHPTALAITDLHRAGVSDAVGHAPYPWLQSITTLTPTPKVPPTSAKTPKPETAAAPVAAVKTAQKKAAPQEQALEEAYIPPTLTHTGAGDIYVLTDAVLTEQESDFLFRILAYTSQPQGNFAFTTFTLNPQQSTLAADVASLHQKLNDVWGQTPPRFAVVLGQQAACVVKGKYIPLAEARPAEGATTTWGEANVPLFVTYHPRTVLAQPVLKKAVWHDILAFTHR